MPSKGSFCAKSDALLIHYVKTTLGGTFHEKQEVQNFRATRAIPGMTRTPALPPSKLLRMRNETTFSHFPHPRTGCRQLKLCTLAQFCTLDTYQKTKIPELLIWTRTSPSKCSLFEKCMKWGLGPRVTRVVLGCPQRGPSNPQRGPGGPWRGL